MEQIMNTKQRAAMEQALDACEQYTAKELTVGQRYTSEGQQLLDAITALRAALAERADTWWQQTDGRDLAYYESDYFKTNQHNRA